MATYRSIAIEGSVNVYQKLLDYDFYMYCRQFEVLPPLLPGLVSKLGFHPVAIAHLSSGTSSLTVS
jgi:hypothetical protein